LGRSDLDLPWERTDKAAVLKQAASEYVNSPVSSLR
jgi:S-adenosylmethionine synthetase